MPTYAMFVKIDGKWNYSGQTENEDRVSAFEDSVTEDIDRQDEMAVKTQASFVVSLPD
jgi:hypothetical protein